MTDETRAAEEFYAREVFPVDLPPAEQGQVGDGMSVSSELPAEPAGPRGIGGWLLVPLIGLVGNPLSQVYMVVTYAALIDRVAVSKMLPYLLMMTYLVAGISVTAFALVTYVMRKRIARWAIIAYMATDAVGGVLVGAAWYAANAPTLGATYLQMGLGMCVGMFIWVPYLLTSRRVRNTFVR